MYILCNNCKSGFTWSPMALCSGQKWWGIAWNFFLRLFHEKSRTITPDIFCHKLTHVANKYRFHNDKWKSAVLCSFETTLVSTRQIKRKNHFSTLNLDTLRYSSYSSGIATNDLYLFRSLWLKSYSMTSRRWKFAFKSNHVYCCSEL